MDEDALLKIKGTHGLEKKTNLRTALIKQEGCEGTRCYGNVEGALEHSWAGRKVLEGNDV